MLNNQIKVKISFSFTEIQTNLKGSLQLSLEIKCDDRLYKNGNKKFQIMNGRSLLFELIELQTSLKIDQNTRQAEEKQVFINIYTHSWNSTKLFGTLILNPLKDKKYQNAWSLPLQNQKDTIKIAFKTKINAQKQLWTHQQIQNSKVNQKISDLKNKKKPENQKKQYTDDLQVEQLKKQNKRLQENLISSQNNVYWLQQKLQKIKSQQEKQNLMNKENEQKIHNLENIILLKQAKIAQLQKQNLKFKKDVEKGDQLLSHQKQMEKKTQQLAKSNLYLLKNVQELQQMIRKLEEQKQILAINFDNAKSAIDQKKIVNNQLSNEIKDLQFKLLQSNQKAKEITSQLSLTTKQKEQTKINLKKCQQLLQEQANKLLQCQKQRQNLLSLIKQSNEQTNKLREEIMIENTNHKMSLLQKDQLISNHKTNSQLIHHQLSSNIAKLETVIKESQQENIKLKKLIQISQCELRGTRSILEESSLTLQAHLASFKSLIQFIFVFLNFLQREGKADEEKLSQISRLSSQLCLRELKIEINLQEAVKVKIFHEDNIRKLEDEKQRTVNQFQKIQQLFTHASIEIDLLKENLASEKYSVSELILQLKDAKNLILDLKQKEVALCEQIKHLESKLTNYKQEYKNLKQKYQQLLKSLESSQRLNGQLTQILKLKNELQEKLETQIKDSNEKIQHMTEQKVEIEAKILYTLKMKQDFQLKLIQIQKEKENLLSTIKESNQQQHKLKELIMNQENNNKINIQQKDLKISQLKNKYETMDKQLSSKMAKLELIIKENHKENLDLKKIIQAFQIELRETKNILEERSHTLQAYVTSSKSLIKSISFFLSSLQREGIRDEQKLSEIIGLCCQLGLGQLNIQNDLEEAVRVKKLHEDNVHKLQSEKQRTISQLQTTRQFFTEATIEINLIKQNLASEKQQTFKLISELKEAKEIIMDLNQKETFLHQQIKNLQFQITKYEEEYQILKSKYYQLMKKSQNSQKLNIQLAQKFQQQKHLLLQLGDQSLIQLKKLCLQTQKKHLKAQTKIYELQTDLRLVLQKHQNQLLKNSYLNLSIEKSNKQIEQISKQLLIYKYRYLDARSREQQNIIQIKNLKEAHNMLYKLKNTLQQSLQQFKNMRTNKISVQVQNKQSKLVKNQIIKQIKKMHLNPQIQSQNEMIQLRLQVFQLKDELQTILFDRKKLQYQKKNLEQKIQRLCQTQKQQTNQINSLKKQVKELNFEVQKKSIKIAYILLQSANLKQDLDKYQEIEKQMLNKQSQILKHRQKSIEDEQNFSKNMQNWSDQKKKLLSQIKELKSQICSSQKNKNKESQKIQKVHVKQMNEIKAQFFAQRQYFLQIIKQMQKQNEIKMDKVQKYIQEIVQKYCSSQRNKSQINQQLKQSHQQIQKLIRQNKNLQGKIHQQQKRYEKLKNFCSQQKQQLKSLQTQLQQSSKRQKEKIQRNISIQIGILKQKINQWSKRLKIDLPDSENKQLIIKYFEQFQQKLSYFMQEMVLDLM